MDYIRKNYNWKDNELENYIKQSVLTCAIVTKHNNTAIPRRYKGALNELRGNLDIVIITTGKRGGVVILSECDYVDNMNALLSDGDTYWRQPDGRVKDEADRFNKDVRRALQRSEEGKKLLHLLEGNLVVPRMRVFPKLTSQEFQCAPSPLG